MMLEQNHKTVRELIAILGQECELQEQYRALLEEERRALTNFAVEQVEEHSLGRAKITEAITEFEQKRRALMRSIDGEGGPNQRLTEWARAHCHARDRDRIFKLAERLKSGIQVTSRLVKEFGSVVDFSMGMISSTLSIIWSATQTVNDTYSMHGEMQKHYVPKGHQNLNLLKTA